MSVTYAGIELNACGPEAAGSIAQRIPLRDVLEFQTQIWPGKNLTGWTFPGYIPDRTVLVNSLWWPRGASRFAIAHFCVTESRLQAIRNQVYAGGSYQSKPLVMKKSQREQNLPLNSPADEQVATITTDMFLISARPLFQFIDSPGVPYWLITLCDDRYWWWWRNTGDINVDENGPTTWEDLYSDIQSALGVDIQFDGIDSDYLYPSKNLSCHQEKTPILLDCVAYNVGQRIVRMLDGTVKARNPDNAKTDQNQQISATDPNKYRGGGFFAYDGTNPINDLAGVLPSGIGITFPDTSSGTLATNPYELTTTLASLALSDFNVATKNNETLWFHDTATYDGTNGAALSSLVAQFATDWYRWQASKVDLSINGIVEWTPTAMDDSIEWHHGLESCYTRIMRGTFNDLTEELLHAPSDGDDILITLPTNICLIY